MTNNENQNIPLNPQGVEAATDECASCLLPRSYHKADGECPVPGYFIAQPVPVPQVTAEDDSVPSALDIAYREGVLAERDQWRKVTGVRHWSDYAPVSPSPR